MGVIGERADGAHDDDNIGAPTDDKLGAAEVGC